jgi:hypothetical protein
MSHRAPQRRDRLELFHIADLEMYFVFLDFQRYRLAFTSRKSFRISFPAEVHSFSLR